MLNFIYTLLIYFSSLSDLIHVSVEGFRSPTGAENDRPPLTWTWRIALTSVRTNVVHCDHDFANK